MLIFLLLFVYDLHFISMHTCVIYVKLPREAEKALALLELNFRFCEQPDIGFQEPDFCPLEDQQLELLIA